MIPIYIASDQRMRRAERVLEYSIRKHTQEEVSIHWMRAGDPGWDDWQGIPDEPYPRSRKGGARVWATMFTNFRFAVPELAKEGFAIYMDTDMLCLGDVRKLFALGQPGRWIGMGGTTCVSVIDASAIRRVLPPIKEQKQTNRLINEIMPAVPFKAGPREWNCVDSTGPACQMIHYSQMRTQPWKPWPERFHYGPATREIDRIWFEYEKEASGE